MNITAALTGLAGGLQGYNQAREQNAQDQQTRQQMLQALAQNAREMAFRQRQAEEQQRQFDAQIAAEANRDKENTEYRNRLFEYNKTHDDQVHDDAQLTNQLNVLKTIPLIQQSYVGAPSALQKSAGESINKALAAVGLPSQPVPYTQTGEMRTVKNTVADPLFAQMIKKTTVPGSPTALVANMAAPTITTEKQFPILYPGFAANVDTQGQIATNERLNAEAEAAKISVALLPIKQRQQYQQWVAEYGLKEAGLRLQAANAAAQRAVTIRGQNMAAATADANRAAENERQEKSQWYSSDQNGIANARDAKKRAQANIDALAKGRNANLLQASGYEAALKNGVTLDGKQLTDDNVKKFYQNQANNLRGQANRAQAQINQIKSSPVYRGTGSAPLTNGPGRDPKTGKFKATAGSPARTQASSGRAYDIH